ncbi:MAG TPA: DUF1579 family protein [Ktedonobacterales bacterium]
MTQAKTPSSQPNPALKSLEVLVGDWEMELSNTSFLPNPSDTATGRVSFQWLQDGAFLVMRMGDKPSSAPDATWLIGRDDSTPNYTVLYYDSRTVSRVYQMSFSDGQWKMWRDAPGFSQRFEGKVRADGKTITARWEKSFDSTTWQHDFNLTYTKIG